MLIALYNRNFEEKNLPTIKRTIDLLHQNNIKIAIYKDFYDRLTPFVNFEIEPRFFSSNKDLPFYTDFFMSLGGDGTLLDTICFVVDSGIPIIGINLGRLGFLADIPENEIDLAIQALIMGSYSIDKRTLI